MENVTSLIALAALLVSAFALWVGRKALLVANEVGEFDPEPVFYDEELLAKGFKPPFEHDRGTYSEENDLIIAGGRPLKGIPTFLDCPSTYIIYSSWAAKVQDKCAGFGGAGDGDNSVLDKALRNANDAVDKINCRQGCTKSSAEIWRGWKCGFDRSSKVYIATGAVQVKVTCATSPGD